MERKEIWNLLNKLRGHESADVLIDLVTYCTYAILRDRHSNLLEHYANVDKNLSADLETQYSDSIRFIKKELGELSDKDLIEVTYVALISVHEMGSRWNDSSNENLSLLAIELLRLEAGDIVFDLGSGNGNFLVNVVKKAQNRRIELKEVGGIELNQRQADLSKMNLCIAGAKYFHVNTGNALIENKDLYNKAYCFPPLGIRLQHLSNKEAKSFLGYKFKPSANAEWVFVDKLLEGLQYNGRRAVAILTQGSLFKDQDKEYRDLLLKSGMLEGIIELPAGSLKFTGVKPCMLVFSEGNREIKILDASNVIEKVPGKFAKMDIPYKAIVQLYYNAQSKSVDSLLEARSLVPSSLLASDKVTNFKGQRLSEVAEVFTGCQYTSKNFEEIFSDEPTGYRILASSDIEDGSVEWNELQSIAYKDNKFDKYAVQKGDVVVTAKSSRVKTVVVDIEPKEKILVTGGMIIVRPNQDKLNPTYFKLFLDSDDGQMLLKSIQRGATIVTINSKDLANINVPDVSLDKQRAVAKQYSSMLSTYLALKEELKKLEDSLRNIYAERLDEE